MQDEASLRRIPVIFLSAVAGAESKVQAFTCGGVDYITKPFQAEEVVSRVETHLSLRALREDLERRVKERTAQLETAAQSLQAEVAQRERLTAILESTSDLVATAVPNGRLSFVNRAGRELLGWPCDGDLSHRTLAEIYPDDVWCAVEAAAIPEATRLGIWKGETAIVDSQGRILPVSQVIMAHRSPAGEIEYLSTIARDISQRKRSEEELRILAVRLRQLGARTLDLEEEERRRVARDMHDRIGPKITAVGISLDRLSSRGGSESIGEGAAGILADARGLLKETAEDLHAVMSDLRPAVLDDYGIGSAIRWHAERFTKHTGIRVLVIGDDPNPRPPANVETALFRGTQEALTNVAKHAKASTVEIRIAVDPETIRVSIVDDGIGFVPADILAPGDAGGWGLLGMSERMKLLRGHLDVTSAPDRGTRIQMEVPTS